MTVRGARDSFDRFESATALPLAALALLIVPALLLEERGSSPLVREVAHGLNWVVWLAFCAEYLVRLVLAPVRGAFVWIAWFDLLLVVLSPPFLVQPAMQGIRTLRVVRVLRLLRIVRGAGVAAIGLHQAGRALRHRRFHLVLTATSAVVAVGARAIFAVESGRTQKREK